MACNSRLKRSDVLLAPSSPSPSHTWPPTRVKQRSADAVAEGSGESKIEAKAWQKLESANLMNLVVFNQFQPHLFHSSISSFLHLARPPPLPYGHLRTAVRARCSVARGCIWRRAAATLSSWMNRIDQVVFCLWTIVRFKFQVPISAKIQSWNSWLLDARLSQWSLVKSKWNAMWSSSFDLCSGCVEGLAALVPVNFFLAPHRRNWFDIQVGSRELLGADHPGRLHALCLGVIWDPSSCPTQPKQNGAKDLDSVTMPTWFMDAGKVLYVLVSSVGGNARNRTANGSWRAEMLYKVLYNVQSVDDLNGIEHNSNVSISFPSEFMPIHTDAAHNHGNLFECTLIQHETTPTTENDWMILNNT